MTEALQTYTILSIGDGLVTQIPAIIVSIAAGILVTRSSEESDLGRIRRSSIDGVSQGRGDLRRDASAFRLLPRARPSGLSFFFPMGCFAAAYFFNKKGEAETSIEEIGTDRFTLPCPIPRKSSCRPGPGFRRAGPGEDGAPQLSPMENAIEQEVFGLEMGYGLLVLADKKKGGDLLDRITGARTNFAKEMGMLLPTIGVRDNIELEPNEYRFFCGARKSCVPPSFPTECWP